MKYSTDQMILAAHVRTLALEFWKAERNAMSDKWHAENPGMNRDLLEFAKELNALKSLNEFILDAAKELENIAGLIQER